MSCRLTISRSSSVSGVGKVKHAEARDAAVIADAARTMPHTLRSISTSDEDAASLSMLTGFDLELARQLIAHPRPTRRCRRPR
ncbi:hypothetical protein DRB07_14520 [Actinomyces sp. Z3]|nr:hypothetical protein DRB07_14520 [Actinomyces sp. Z3]